jgi:hypothetical protein
MSDLYFETQDLTVEIDTEDEDLELHTLPKIWFIYTDADGEASEPEALTGLVTDDSVMYAALEPLEIGVYRVWAESVDTNGKQCVSPAFSIPASARGTVRPS